MRTGRPSSSSGGTHPWKLVANIASISSVAVFESASSLEEQSGEHARARCAQPHPLRRPASSLPVAREFTFECR